MRFLINIHSYVDLITNSSSEIFVAADAATLTAVKKLINSILAMGGSMSTADDLFNMSLVITAHNENYDEVYLPYDSPAGKKYRDDYDGESPIKVSLEVKALSNTKEAAEAARVLSNLTGLFSISEVYN